MAHIWLQLDSEEQGRELVGFQVGEVDTGVEVRSDGERSDVLIQVSIVVLCWNQVTFGQQLLVMKVELAARDGAVLSIKVESAMTRLGATQNGSVERLVEVWFMFEGYRIANV